MGCWGEGSFAGGLGRVVGFDLLVQVTLTFERDYIWEFSLFRSYLGKQSSRGC